ncbi:AAA family ATPase [Pendulispora brunnea]|uniref:AAA family ATPase n=1 Tax=Pendulispora brunnea TaxID=2905690 RepID=A0ABZ2KMJ8_9BACT
MTSLLRLSRKGTVPQDSAHRFPFGVPAIRTLTTLDLSAAVTFFVGENGSGKSTLLEAMACVTELPSLGSDDLGSDDTLAPQRELARDLRLAWNRRSRRGFFLRAEDFFGYLRRQARNDARIRREELEREGLFTDDDVDASITRHVDERFAARHVSRYDARSHGESFIELFEEKVQSGGLYLLDEPEAPLSPKRQLELLRIIRRATKADAQFIIATHSPILLACPGARIFSFDDPPIRAIAYDALEHVRVTRDFLHDPAKYLDDP